MDAVLRVTLIYGFLLVVFRLAGRRSLSEATTFDLLMLLIISETTQQAMVDDDHSLTHACILILTLVGLDLGLSLLKDRSKRLEKLLDDVPVLLASDGQTYPDRMRGVRIDQEDLLEAVRRVGLESMDQVKYAVAERDGRISIIPREPARPAARQ